MSQANVFKTTLFTAHGLEVVQSMDPNGVKSIAFLMGGQSVKLDKTEAFSLCHEVTDNLRRWPKS